MGGSLRWEENFCRICRLLCEEFGVVIDWVGIYEIIRKIKIVRFKSRLVGVCVVVVFVDFVVLGFVVLKIEFLIKIVYICIVEGNLVGLWVLFVKEVWVFFLNGRILD